MKYDKQRLFEVTARLDKTFKPKLNEELEVLGMDAEEVPAEEPAMDVDGAEEPVEQSPEEKLAELTAKIDSLYAMVHGDEEGEESAEAEEEEIEGEGGEEVSMDVENLQEWNFDKKKDAEHKEKAEDKEEDEKEEMDEEIEAPAKPKIPVQAVAKVGGAK